MGTLATPTTIAEHADFLRRLAHALVRDAASADDAVQETVLRALEAPPHPERGTTADRFNYALPQSQMA